MLESIFPNQFLLIVVCRYVESHFQKGIENAYTGWRKSRVYLDH